MATIYKCTACGSKNVQAKAWIYLNDQKFDSWFEDSDYYCADCDSFVNVMEEEIKFKFKLPIGDWSNDGHGINDYYTIESNFPVEQVRELYFQACNKIGFTLDGHSDKSPCAEYGDNHFPEETLEELLKFGVKISEEDCDYIRKEKTIESKMFCDLVLRFIETQDSELHLTIIDDDVPMFQFYGFDKQNRHIGYFGYGLFDL